MRKQAMFLVLLSLLAFTATALAQTGYEVPWWTVDGGGGASSAVGSYSLVGTVGQADAGGMSGGDFALCGGFWPGGAAVPAGYAIYLPLVLRNQ